MGCLRKGSARQDENEYQSYLRYNSITTYTDTRGFMRVGRPQWKILSHQESSSDSNWSLGSPIGASLDHPDFNFFFFQSQ